MPVQRDPSESVPPPPPGRDPEWLYRGILERDPARLAQGITLIESRAPAHREAAHHLLRLCMPQTGNSLRLGITGVPGVGKSTFIERFGLHWCGAGHRVAVLAVDPSSSIHGGSILGDKTRMEELSRHPAAFIRPSPSGGTLGGVAARTREAMLLCEAAGFDRIIVESVGVGQSEITLRSMVDFYLLLQLPNAGDELQGIKKGVIEMADAIAINKCDGSNKDAAALARVGFARVLGLLTPFTPGWSPPALACSAVTGEGIEALDDVITKFVRKFTADGTIESRRKRQNAEWFRSLVQEAVWHRFAGLPGMRSALENLESEVTDGRLPVSEAVDRVLRHGHQKTGASPPDRNACR